jgi:hypothetical protein
MGFYNLPKTTLQTTFANRPTASLFTGKTIYMTDIGPAGSYWISNGTRWQPLGGSCLIAISQVASSVTGTASETNLASVTIPAGLMSANGQLEILTLWSYTNSGTARNCRIRLGTDTTSGTVFFNPSVSTTNTLQSYINIKNNNATNSQYGFPNSTGAGYATSTAALITSSWNTATTSHFVAFNGALTDTSQTITIEGYSITYVEG